ncbi:MAG: NADH-quinone oxidoreductase subunit NuoF [Chloroflexi bacterium]|nr:NADH-quinone oxidoreductase subunit NuoF [Anaerolineae bacterium]RLC73361.1 MAG: NADH-quinone oxidoreductase subunit NuoF [Chloroflexota bacterium]
MRILTLRDLEMAGARGTAALYPSQTKIMVGMATCGLASGAQEVYDALLNEVSRQGVDAVIRQVGCIGWCCKEPLVDVLSPGKPRITYGEITAKRVPKIVEALAQGEIVKEWAIGRLDGDENLIEGTKRSYLADDAQVQVMNQVPLYKEIDLFKDQVRIVMRNCGIIDPRSIDEYIARGGYLALYKALNEMSPEEVIEEITRSGLRGRGGAGFPTGLKWKFTRQSKGDTKYIICNADEGDPGAYMDRSVLEGDPHTVIEGMIIGAYAIGASEGYIYVRAEYPLAIEMLTIAIQQAEEYGLLGQNILGSGMDFQIKLSMGAGAFVCGEETALMASIEGRAGEPRPRPPFPAQSGLWGQPTNINNVETWANVPVIVARGGDWYARIGTETSKGTKVFSLVGKITNNSLIEVPMGITLRQIIYGAGGGIADGREFKAVQTGGPSGGCIPAELIDLPVDYEQLTQAGSIMGSGGMIVLDDRTCMVDLAKYFFTFLKGESCGKCIPCRLGINRMQKILTDITEGRGKEGDIELLEQLAVTVKGASLCGLGQTAPNPVLTTIRYFRDEFEAHIKEKRCPAGVCRELIEYSIDAEKCTGCGRCVRVCPQEAIVGEKKKPHVLDPALCIKCGACYEVCKFGAVVLS